MKKKLWILAMVLLYAAIAAGIAWMIHMGGRYPAGTDTMSHVYKGNLLYHSIREGNWYPLYDEFWYNGVQVMRYGSPLPAYVLAFCQALAGGDAVTGYLCFVAFVFFFGALAWLYIGVRKERFWLGAFFGILWFFMPNNLYTLFVEGNLPRSLSMVLLPLLLYFVYEYLRTERWQKMGNLIAVFTGIGLCHAGYAGMILLAMLLFLLVYRIIYRKKGKCLLVIAGLILPFLLIGIWLFAALRGGSTAADISQVMQRSFQDAVVSLNPFRRLMVGHVEFYFGLAAFLITVFGGICSKKKSIIGFWSAILIFLCTTTMMCAVLEKLPGGEYLWMLRFISIALCMILYSFLLWDTLRRWIVVLCVALLVMDTIPSLSLVYSGGSQTTASQWMEETAQDSLIRKAQEITTQRAALLDGGTLGAMAQYLLVDYDGTGTRSACGAGWQSAATEENILLLNEAVEQGQYRYLFDRCLELGNDTVLIKISQMKYGEADIPQMTESAGKRGYQLVDTNDSFLLYHLRTAPDCFGTVCQYNGIGIGTAASLMVLSDPDIVKGDSINLNEYSYEELSGYKVVYLAGFEYDDKKKAEELVIRLSEAGVRVVIIGDGLPYHKNARTQEFLGVTCHDILFENGYPVLYTEEGEVDCGLFDKEYSDWKCVYFNGLENTKGYLYDAGRKIDFLGTVKNENICFIGLNLTFHYALTRDESAGELIHSVTGEFLRELPDRRIVPLEVTYGRNRLTISSPEDGVNTSLAYHDIFRSRQKLKHKNQLTYVDRGKTIITMGYPYLAEGLCMSLMGIVLTVVFLLWLRWRETRAGAEMHHTPSVRAADKGEI
ncbi:MAG: hypothetical protein K2J67_08755 [Lachnospiraceae bacterium]|nr:hypothetical protein [Lachnospiraceae bacterium]